jgi:hypothetical protein
MHFSRVTDVPRLAQELKRQVLEFARIARAHAADADPARGIRADMLALWVSAARRHGLTLSEAQLEKFLEGDLELNTQGLVVWLEREQRQ